MEDAVNDVSRNVIQFWAENHSFDYRPHLTLNPPCELACQSAQKAEGMRTEPFRVVVWGPGTIGRACIRELLQSPAYTLVGVLAHSPDQEGLDVGELAGRDPIGVRATTNKTAILALDADVVLHAPRVAPDLTPIDQDVVSILESGKNVISSTSYHYPFRHGRDYVEMLHSAGKRGGSTLLGTGVHPGFMGDILALTLSGLCTHIETMTIREYVDVSHSTNAAGMQLFGFNGDPVELATREGPAQLIMDRYWGDSLAFLARVMFDEDARIERRSTYVPAAEPIELPAFTIAKGRVAEMRHLFTASIDGRPRLVIDETLYQTERNRPHPHIESSDFYEIEIEGRPSSIRMRLALKASLVRGIDFWPGDPTGQAWYATATPMLQAIPLVAEAEAGLMLPEVPRRFVRDARHHLSMPALVRQELLRLGVQP